MHSHIDVWPKNLNFKKIITNHEFHGFLLVHPLNILFFIKNGYKLIYNMLRHKSSDAFFIFQIRPNFLKKWFYFCLKITKKSKLWHFLWGKWLFLRNLSLIWKTKKKIARFMSEHGVFFFYSNFQLQIICLRGAQSNLGPKKCFLWFSQKRNF